jgi:hypothetical protein
MTPDTCPLCGKQLLNPNGLQQANKRICSLCHGRIKKTHRWHIGSTGLLEHRDCMNPTGKTNTEYAKGLF